MLHIARSLPAGRFAPVPLSVIRGTNSPVHTRRAADKGDSLKMLRNVETHDDWMTLDSMDLTTHDGAGAFLVGELERLDQRLHMPLAAVTWQEDVDLRTDVSMGDEISSYTNSTFAAYGGIPGSNKSWIDKDATAIQGIDLDITKTTNKLPLWARELSWTLPELASAARVGRPVDSQKFDGMMLKYNLDVDEQVYIGDTILGMTGLLNHTLLTNTGNAVTGGWSTATPAQILADVNSILTSVWGASGVSMFPNKLLVSPADMAILVSTLISSAGNISILNFLRQNNIAAASGQTLEIQARKWCLGTNNSFGGFAGVGPTATNCMFAYYQAPDRVRFPLVPLQRTPLEYRGLRQITTYYGRLGNVEAVYPELMARRSNIN
jgi:hypothetical protein